MAGIGPMQHLALSGIRNGSSDENARIACGAGQVGVEPTSKWDFRYCAPVPPLASAHVWSYFRIWRGSRAFRACLQSASRKSAVRSVSDPETLAEIDAAHIGVGDDLSGGAIHQNLAIMQDIGAVDDLERLAHIMVGDQHADAAVLQMADKGADLADRDRVDPGKGLVEQD